MSEDLLRRAIQEGCRAVPLQMGSLDESAGMPVLFPIWAIGALIEHAERTLPPSDQPEKIEFVRVNHPDGSYKELVLCVRKDDGELYRLALRGELVPASAEVLAAQRRWAEVVAADEY